MKTGITKLAMIFLAVISLSILSLDLQAQDQDKKLSKAETTFCNDLGVLIDALVTLDAMNENATDDEFKKAYNEAVKAYNKADKAAAKLEKVEMKESQKAYNEMVDSINAIDGDTKTSAATEQINDNIDATSAAINDILTVVCQ